MATPSTSAAVTADHLYGTSLLSNGEGWAAGAFGTILYTRDGGVTWYPQTSGVTEPLFDIDFADAQHGWAVGRSGRVLGTHDGGKTWRAQASATTNHLFEVVALGRQRAWAVGDWGTVVTTTDGGATWQDRSLGRDVILNGMSWPDETHGWIVGEAGEVLATEDGGKTWHERRSGVDKTLFGVFFETPQRGWIVGLDGLILRTDDAGMTWQVQHGEAAVAGLEQVGFAEAFGNPSLYAVTVTEGYGMAVGDNGSIFVSADGGARWRRSTDVAAARMRWVRGVSLGDDGRGVVVGANGLAAAVDMKRLTGPERGADAPEGVD